MILQTFFSNFEDLDQVDEALLKRALQFRDYLSKKFKLDFTVEDDDDMPTIVDT